MKLPKSVMILGHRYKVELVELEEDGFGYSEGNARIIRINPKHPANTYMATLLHEIIHQIFHITGLSNMLDSTKEDKFEEAIVVALEHGLSPYFTIPKGCK